MSFEPLRYLHHVMDHSLNLSREPEDRIRLACSRYQLEGAVEALRFSGQLSDEDAALVLEQYDNRLRESGLLSDTTTSLATLHQVAENTGEESPTSSKRRTSRSAPSLWDVVPAVGHMGVVDGIAITAISLEIWSGGFLFSFYTLGNRELSSSAVLHMKWGAGDSEGNRYRTTQRGGNAHFDGFRGFVYFSGPIANHVRSVTIDLISSSGSRASHTIVLPSSA